MDQLIFQNSLSLRKITQCVDLLEGNKHIFEKTSIYFLSYLPYLILIDSDEITATRDGVFLNLHMFSVYVVIW